MNQKISIPNSNGETLHAALDLPKGQGVEHIAIFAHCFTCSSQLSIVRNISRELTNFGIGVLRFDFTGLGHSEGEFEDTNFSHNLEDLISVYRYMQGHYKAPELLVGHSLGGAAALMASGSLGQVKAVATIGAPADAVHVQHLFGQQLHHILEQGEAELNIGGRPFRIKKQFLDDLEQHDADQVIPNLRIPLLIMHSPQDRIVGIENAAKIYQWAHHPKSFISLDGADHLLTNKADSIYAARMIASWADRYLNIRDNTSTSPHNDAQVVAHLDLDDGFTTHISNGKNHLLADEPEDVGGAGLGFSPYEIIQAGLGACTNMTLKLYAQRKKWPLTQVRTSLSFQRKEINGVKKPAIQKSIELQGPLSEEQRARLLEIASKCPVNKSLIEGFHIQSVP